MILVKSARSMLTKEWSHCLCPSPPVPMLSLVGSRPKTRHAYTWNSASVIQQLCPDLSSSSVLPPGSPPSPMVMAVVLAA